MSDGGETELALCSLSHFAKMSPLLLIALLCGVARLGAAQDLPCTDSSAGSYQTQSGHVLPDYNVVDGVPGGDPMYGGTAQDSATACWEFCQSVKGCVSATYNLQGTVNCYLKNVNPGPGNSEPNPAAVTLSACGDPGRIGGDSGSTPPATDASTPPSTGDAPPPMDTTTMPPATMPPTDAPTAPDANSRATPTAPATDIPTDTIDLSCTTAQQGQDYDGSDIAELPTDTAEECATVCAYVVQCAAVSYLASGKCYLKSSEALVAGLVPKSGTQASYDMTQCKDTSSYTVLDITDPGTVAGLTAAYPGFTVIAEDAIGTDTPPMTALPPGATMPPMAGMSPPTTTTIAVSVPPPASPSTTTTSSTPPPTTVTNGSFQTRAAGAVLAVAMFGLLLL